MEGSTTCYICKEQMSAGEIFSHLENVHGIAEEDVLISETRREIRRKATEELLATWSEISQ